MLYAAIAIIAVAVVLFVLSFFLNDRFKEMESQLEQLTLTTMQDNYQLKKKVKILEGELLTQDLGNESQDKKPS
ncbi:hypothetical protein ACFOGI_02215 [Virgibacillus xinjiangensis]|uniref:Uncharacterized protein n=1 Tax=Virgibacillus xinjiangensis TaxID=393090 RepID=A0ABV7CRS5_9BACI